MGSRDSHAFIVMPNRKFKVEADPRRVFGPANFRWQVQIEGTHSYASRKTGARDRPVHRIRIGLMLKRELESTKRNRARPNQTMRETFWERV